ncbi:hypothetical protein ACIOHC_36180 [Streptomyces sp. NPDC088252]
MSWGISGLHGKAAEEEGIELTELLALIQQSEVIKDGRVEWDA